jgi:hypothetical protein
MHHQAFGSRPSIFLKRMDFAGSTRNSARDRGVYPARTGARREGRA